MLTLPIDLKRLLISLVGVAFVVSLGDVPAHASTGKGQVDVLYAGSLVPTMNQIGSAFDRATGYTFEGFSAGSTALANEIKGGTQKADVFISAGRAANRSLEGRSNGNWETWYAQFGTTPLVLGYEPSSRFATRLKTLPWYKVIVSPGFRFGRTDPAIDPKGVLSVTALKDAERLYHQPALAQLLKSDNGVFPEETLVGRLEAGQLDAGFFYGVEASAAHLDIRSLAPIDLFSPYTISEIDHAPHPRGAIAFISFLLGKSGRAILAKEGLRLNSPPLLYGSRRNVPVLLRSTVR